MSKTIYKKDTKNNIRYITYSTDGNILIQESGLLDTDSPVINERVCKAKNIGKSNETTAEEQAIKEMQSKIADKLKKEYFETIEDAKNNVVIKPMLAETFEKFSSRKDILNKKYYVQPKLDGMRCVAFINNGNVILKSRDNTTLSNDVLKHIVKKLKQFPDCILDGELYAHNYSFQENMSYCKKYTKDLTETIKYCIYDTIIDADYSIRRTEVVSLVTTRVDVNSSITVVPTYFIGSEFTSIDHLEESIKKYNDEFINSGYEGSIIRSYHGLYEQGKRSKHLIKYKNFIDVKCKLVDVVPFERDPTMGTPVLEIKNNKGIMVNFEAGTALSHEERKDLLSNKYNYIAKIAEIRFFEWTDDGKPRMPVLYGFID